MLPPCGNGKRFHVELTAAEVEVIKLLRRIQDDQTRRRPTNVLIRVTRTEIQLEEGAPKGRLRIE